MFIKTPDETILYVPGTSKSKLIKDIPAGRYDPRMGQTGIFFIPNKLIEKPIPTTGGVFDSIHKKIQERFHPDNDKIMKKMGLCNKLGALLHGSAGTGKTCFVVQLCNMLIERYDACVLMCTNQAPHQLVEYIKAVKESNEDKLVIVVIEELDQFIHVWRNYLASFLQILDGSDSHPKTVFLCTTNHIDKLPASLIDRPSRFSIIEEMELLPEETIINIVKAKLPTDIISNDALHGIIEESIAAKLPIDKIKDVIIDVAIHSIHPREAVQRQLNYKKFLAEKALKEETPEQDT